MLPMEALDPCDEIHQALLKELTEIQPDEFPEKFAYAYHKYASKLYWAVVKPQPRTLPPSPLLNDIYLGVDSLYPLIKHFRDLRGKDPTTISPADLGKAFCAYWQTVGLKPANGATAVVNTAAAIEGAFVWAVYEAITDEEKKPPFYTLILSVQEIAVKNIQWVSIVNGYPVKEAVTTTYGTNLLNLKYIPGLMPGGVYPVDLNPDHK